MSVTPESIKAMIERERPKSGNPVEHLESLAFVAVDSQLLASTWSAQLETAERIIRTAREWVEEKELANLGEPHRVFDNCDYRDFELLLDILDGK